MVEVSKPLNVSMVERNWFNVGLIGIFISPIPAEHLKNPKCIMFKIQIVVNVT